MMETVGTFAGGRPGGSASRSSERECAEQWRRTTSCVNVSGKATASAHSLSRYVAVDELWIGIEGNGIDTLWLPNFNAPTATKNSASAYSLWNAESNPNRTATR